MLGALKFNSAKCETTCRLCLGRIKLLKNKRNMQVKGYRRDIAELLRAGKQDYARIRVEAVIREQLTLTAYEILELYLELLAVRSALVATSKEIPRDMVEALSSVLYASSRVPDLPELTTLHKMFVQKYGKEYVGEACSDVSCNRWMVNENLRHCLTIEPPEPALKLETLSEIAQEFGVEWDMDRARRDLLGDVDPMMMGLPSAAAMTGAAGGPIPGSSAMYQQQQQSEPMQVQPPTMQQQQQQSNARPAAGVGGAGEYADVAAAAAAAVAAAQQAKNAAVAAARLAGVNGGGVPPGAAKGHDGGSGGSSSNNSGGGGGGGGGGMMASGPPPSGPPAQGWLTGVDSTGSHITPPAAAAAGSTGSSGLQMHSLPTPAAGHTDSSGTTDKAPGSGYRIPSSEEIQRAYDNAQGPPAKTGSGGVAAAAGQPPAVAPGVHNEASGAAAEAGSGDGSSAADGDLGLPGVPHTGGSAASGGATNEYDELQKRFEALKKS